jgi:membrane fusion protein, multidrug efflux system
VQRVPVRIALDPHELAANPLQIGLPMKAEVNVHNDSGVRRDAERKLASAAAASSDDRLASAR